ncbi:TetR/AcrR family transcriptional regulator [Thalassobaculum salexigens]|uniref:TetR/AcrR family transcriptional regulator n=1 Tax=Thalassobaculum salexigens TaxID=455360 RepID=UPI0004267692|nr:TetR/AcrR family transcriptional regulator [Thalassobaculum salexigens]
MSCSKEDGKKPTRGEIRRRALVDAAWSLVKESGIEAITLDEIIARAGGSRATIYSAFGDKNGLIKAAVGENCSAFAEQMMEMLDDCEEPAVSLTRLASNLVGHIWTPEATRIFGSFLTEGDRFPQVIDAFLQNGPDRLHRRLARYLAESPARSAAPVEDPEAAAKLFLDTLHGDWLIGSLGGRPPRNPDTPETRRWIRYVVARTLNLPIDAVPLTAPG